MGKRTIPLYIKILIGMVGGIVFGVVAYNLGLKWFVTDWIRPFGEIFMRLLKCIAIPLVFISLIKGVSNIGNIGALSKLGVKTLLIYIGTTVCAILIGLTLVLSIAPGKLVDSASVEQMQVTYHATANVVSEAETATSAPLDALVNIIPENVLGSLSNNGAMLQVIFIALIGGIAILLVGKEKTEPLMKVVDTLDAIVMKIIDLIMMFAPFGVFGLMASMVVDNADNMSLIAALGMYVVTVVVGLLFLILVFYPLLVRFFGGHGVKDFLTKMIPVQLLAFTTSSSAATLPLTMETVTTKLGVSEKTAAFVLPVGVTINMDGTSLYQVVAAVFIAQVLGIDLSLGQLATIVLTTTLSSIGTPGVPGGSVVILVMVLSSVGIPAEGLALILGLDRPLDMLRTVVNVTGDATVCKIVDRK